MMTMLELEKINVACRVNAGGFIEGRKGIFFVHGSGSDHTVWNDQFDLLEKEFNVAVLDLPGHGSSEGEGEKDVARYMDWVTKAITKLSITRPVVVGHSLGAAISLALAINRPEIISGVVIVGGGARMPVSQMVFDGLRDNFDRFIELSPDFAVYRENREKVQKVLLEGFSRARPEVFLGDFMACNGFNIEEKLGEIECPTLIVCGDRDMLMPPKYSEALHKKIKSSRCEIIPQCGHFPMLEKSDAFTSLVKNFIETVV